MLHYPKIPSAEGCPGGRCVAFDKVDGTNLHWSWDREFDSWHSFGTRRDAFNLDGPGIERFAVAHPELAGCAELFLAGHADALAAIFREHEDYRGSPAFKVFTEYAGPGSFAGRHRPGDVMSLSLFDVWAEGFGFVGPETFVRDFGHLPAPRVVYRGKFTGQLTEDVRRGKYDVAEGVVIKGGKGGEDGVWMVKVKTNAYLKRLQESFGARWQDYWE